MALIGKQHDFNFHSRCKASKLNHLCLADDLIIFCKGETTIVSMIIQGLQLFQATTGLKANKGKSAFYTRGMEDQEMENIAAISGFQVGSLPFIYLGVPVSARKLNAGDGEQMIDKMIARIRV